jgi:ABC-type dipeptide/oligopeptide/nickel transport system, ATPase component
MGKSLFEHHLRGKSIEPRTKIAPRGHVSDPVLRSVSFSLEGGQKLGIYGRTGR